MSGILSAFEGGFPANPVVSGAAAINEVLTSSSATAAAWQLGLVQQAATPVAGFALQNGTPTIVSWTAPNDGKQHRVIAMGGLSVASAETGGLVNISLPLPNAATIVQTFFSANQGSFTAIGNFTAAIVGAGQTVSILQASALTVGAATVWAELWAS